MLYKLFGSDPRLSAEISNLKSVIRRLTDDYEDFQSELLRETEHTHQATLKTVADLVNQQNTIIKSLTERVDNQQSVVAAQIDIIAKKESDDPWVELKGGDVDPEKGLELQLDWNNAFIDQLKAQGYRGNDEGQLVAQWLLQISQSVAVNSLNNNLKDADEHLPSN